MIRTSNRVRRVLARTAIAASVVVAPMLVSTQASAQPEPAAPAPQSEVVVTDQPGDNQAEFVHRGWRGHGHGFGGWYGRPFHGWNHHGWHGHGWNHQHVNPGWPAPAPWPGGGVRVILPMTGSAY